MEILLKIFLLQVVILLTGCSGLISQPQQNVPVEEPAGSNQSTTVNPGTSQIDDILRIEALSAEDALSADDKGLGRPAVLALLESAEQEKRGGQADSAAAILERALRLEPKNALLWSRLAEVRLIQKSWQQAYVLANKSNSLAQGDRALQLQNWQIIEQAKAAQGDMAGLDQARSRLRELSESSP